jgi:hypothetical protein
MSTDAKNSPPRGATAIPALAALSCAPAQTAVIPGHAGHGPVAAYEHRRATFRVAALLPFLP